MKLKDILNQVLLESNLAGFEKLFSFQQKIDNSDGAFYYDCIIKQSLPELPSGTEVGYININLEDDTMEILLDKPEFGMKDQPDYGDFDLKYKLKNGKFVLIDKYQ